jgi:hypothetical protein
MDQKQLTSERISDDLLVGATAIGEEIGQSRNVVYHLHKRRLIPTARHGGKLIAFRSELRRYLQKLTAAAR